MAPATARARRDGGRARMALRARLEQRREEIEAAALTRVRAIAGPAEVVDPAYAEGLRAAVSAAVAYGTETTGREGPDPPIPVALLAQARMAARVGIPLDTVLRRYFAGYSLLGYFILEEASHAGMTDGDELKRLLGNHAGIFDRLLAAVGEEYWREAEAFRANSSHRQTERIERLLAGEAIDTSEIPYDFDGWHVGLVTAGPDAEQYVRKLAASLDCCLLCVPREEDALLAWLGARRRLDPDELLSRLTPGHRKAVALGESREGPAMALGEPADGLAGWRLTHRQAAAAIGVARQGFGKLVRYADVALFATALQDDLLAESLRRLYLEPLEDGRDGGVLRSTLLTYLEHERNSASTAAALGVTRQTVNSRLRVVEEKIGRPLASCASEFEIALRLHAEEAFPGESKPSFD